MDILLFGPSRVFVERHDLDPTWKAFQSDPLGMYVRMRRLAIRRAADGDHHALDFLLRDFIGTAKQGRDPVAHVVAHVLERFLAVENVGKLLGTQPKRGRPRTHKKAILIHAMVQYLMLLRILRLGQTQRRGDNAQTVVAEALGMSPDTVRDNYRRASKLIKMLRDTFPFIDLEGSGFSAMEEVYITCGVEIRANRGKRHCSSTHLAWYKNLLENIIEAIRTPDLSQAPANGELEIVMIITLRYPLGFADRQI